MIKISIMYLNSKDARFDMDYYLKVHMPMSISRLSVAPGFIGVSVERGLGSGTPGSKPHYVALCHYVFDSFEAFLAAFNKHSALLEGDISNYTNLKPMIQVSAVEMTA